jgi:hypothetical protein
MPKKPVTPFTRYSRPAILAAFGCVHTFSPFAHDSRLRCGPSLAHFGEISVCAQNPGAMRAKEFRGRTVNSRKPRAGTGEIVN